MNKLTEKIFDCVPYGNFTSQEVANLFPGSRDRRFGLVKRAIASGEIIHIRRGLYCLAPKYRKESINLHALAQQIELTTRALIAAHPGLDGDDAPYWALPATTQLKNTRRLIRHAADLAKNLQRHIAKITLSTAEEEHGFDDLPF